MLFVGKTFHVRSDRRMRERVERSPAYRVGRFPRMRSATFIGNRERSRGG